MNRRHLLLFFAAMALAAPAFSQLSNEQIVANAYPRELVSDDDDTPFSTFATADYNHDGSQQIVALYTNGSRASIRVLDSGGHVLGESHVRALKGWRGELELLDIDGDGAPEVVARLIAGHGFNVPDSWVFRWTGNDLVLISPTKRAGTLDLTCFGQVAFYDVDGDGQLDVIALPRAKRDENGTVVDDGEAALFRFSNGAYTAAPLPLTYTHRYSRGTSAPNTVSTTFSARAGATTTLRLVNAGVGSGQVLLNGVKVFAPEDFKVHRGAATRAVTLAATNTLSVTLAGAPGGSIWLLVDDPAGP